MTRISSVRSPDPVVDITCSFLMKPNPKIADEHLRVEDAHDDLFAERSRQRGNAELDLLALVLGLDPPVLRASAFGNVPYGTSSSGAT